MRVDTLDHLTAGMALNDDVLVKIDTEGGDLNVIRGGEETLRRATAVIVESWFYPTQGGNRQPAFEDISRALSELGFCYRGNLRCAWRGGVCDGADALLVRRSEAHRLAA